MGRFHGTVTYLRGSQETATVQARRPGGATCPGRGCRRDPKEGVFLVTARWAAGTGLEGAWWQRDLGQMPALPALPGEENKPVPGLGFLPVRGCNGKDHQGRDAPKGRPTSPPYRRLSVCPYVPPTHSPVPAPACSPLPLPVPGRSPFLFSLLWEHVSQRKNNSTRHS